MGVISFIATSTDGKAWTAKGFGSNDSLTAEGATLYEFEAALRQVVAGKEAGGARVEKAVTTHNKKAVYTYIVGMAAAAAPAGGAAAPAAGGGGKDAKKEAPKKEAPKEEEEEEMGFSLFD